MHQPDIMAVESILQTPIALADNTSPSHPLPLTLFSLSSLFLLTIVFFLVRPMETKNHPSSATFLQALTKPCPSDDDDERCNLSGVFDETA